MAGAKAFPMLETVMAKPFTSARFELGTLLTATAQRMNVLFSALE